MSPGPDEQVRFGFGRFLVLPQRREVLGDGQPLKLGGRAFDVLLALIEARGGVVSKDALMARVWPDRVVEENALQVQISALRAAFGSDRELIRTVSGRGYQFTGAINIQSDGSNEHIGLPRVTVASGAAMPPTNLPESISELIGRGDELREVVSLAASHRLVTLTGPGGIGKTRLALAAARESRPEFAQGVWLAEFSPVSDPAMVPATVAAAAGLELGRGEITPRRVAQALAGRRLLLVLDTCEHVIDAAAEQADAMVRAGAGVSIIATSREWLRVDGEQVYSVPPLAVPTENDEAWRYGAVQLFAARSRGRGAHLSEDPRVGLAIAAICRQLDGIPLAIELAAARAAALGVEKIAAHIGDRFNLLTGGRRTGLPRHQTLRAALDWSFELLSEAERVVLSRVAVFAGAFTLEAAVAVAASTDTVPLEVVDGLSGLVAKSLVARAAERTVATYRLLDTTRAYALEKLIESGEVDAIRRRHAESCLGFLQAAAIDPVFVDWPAAHAAGIDNIRAALAWAFAPGGDQSIGVALAAASVPIWFEISRLAECRGWTEKALETLDARDRGTRTEMVLQTALGLSLRYTQGVSDRARAALTRAGELAEAVHDLGFQLRILIDSTLLSLRLENLQGALALARRTESIAKSTADPVDILNVASILGGTLFLMGDYAAALTYAQHARRRTTHAIQRSQIVRWGLNLSLMARCFEARILWHQGLPDRARETIRSVLADTEEFGHPASLGIALSWCVCLILLELGDLNDAEAVIARLKELAASHGFNHYHAAALGYEGQLFAKRGDFMAGARLLRASLDGLQAAQYEALYTPFLSGLADVLARTGRVEEGLAFANEALLRCEQNDTLWWMPEALRIKGEILVSYKGDTTAAEDHFRRSLDLAHRQGALSWELRTATSLARSRRDTSRIGDARDLLAAVYGRFTEGFGTADLLSASTLIDEMNV